MRLVTNWKRTLKLFLVPALVMLVALYLFPALVNYLSTGSLGRTAVLICNAPDSFLEYVDGLNVGATYTFKEIDPIEDDELQELVQKGRIVIVFDEGYEINVIKYYKHLEAFYESYDPERLYIGDEYPITKAEVNLYYKADSSFSARALQLQNDILDNYFDAYPDLAGIDTSNIPDSQTEINSFNPVTKILMNRVQANSRAGRIVPQIIVLMMYYCIYALSLDIFAGDRERGFLTKLIMTPVSKKTIIWGKLITIGVMSLASTVIIFLMMFLASWLNFSNDALSLIPFGMLYLPGQLIKIFIVALSSGILMISICVWIIFELRKPEDITINLQIPLVTILVELFAFMLRIDKTIFIEYLLPIHNTMTSIQTIMLSSDKTIYLVLTVITNTLYTSLILNDVLKKEDYK